MGRVAKILVAVWVMLLASFTVHLAEAHGDHQWIASGRSCFGSMVLRRLASHKARHAGHVARHDVHPVQTASPRLFSKPRTASSSQESSTEALAGKDVPTGASAPAPLVPNDQSQDATNAVPVTGVGPQKKAVPISVFVSRKLSTLFVRQGFTPLFDVPIKIENPDEPLGTHVFTLLEPQSEGASFRWNVVSLPENFSSASPNSNKKPKAPVQASVGTVGADPLPNDGIVALDRIEIPQDGVARISQLLTPGSSLIVSDYGLSSETGSDTDFIVEMP
jgi:hypothetical protein